MRQRESSLGVAWGARRKPGLASPANMSKRGLSARHSVPNQTLSLVNFRLPKGNVAAANPGRPGGYGLGPGFHARKVVWAGWSPRPSRRPFGGLPQTMGGYDFAFSRRIAPEVCWRNFSPSRLEGAGKTGCLLHPRSRVRFARTKLHTSIQGSGSIPAFPAQWLYGLLRALPGERLFYLRRCAETSTQLSASTAASGPHDFAVRSSCTRQSQLLRPSHLTARS